MKHVSLNMLKSGLLLVVPLFVSCTNRTGFNTKPIDSPSLEQPEPPKLDKTIQALNALQSVTIVTCANGTKGLRVVDSQGNSDDVACGGDRGPQGVAGNDGVGIAGPAGPVGPKGDTGSPGPAGGQAYKLYDADNTLLNNLIFYAKSGSGGSVSVLLQNTQNGYIGNFAAPGWTYDSNVAVGARIIDSFFIFYENSNCTGNKFRLMASTSMEGNMAYKHLNGKEYIMTGASRPQWVQSFWDELNQLCRTDININTVGSDPKYRVLQEVTNTGFPTANLKFPLSSKYQ
ncbi:collagen-like protein [Bdellovibrio bacteriovorus]|uniref:collagen-like triple helix repeat-containing protein n=1 Tax=Bdellovibrio bacteriovorus TaxID=959 RepID=UPI0035A6FA49